MKTHSPYFLLAAMLIAQASTKLAHAQGELYFVKTTSDTVVAGACTGGTADCSLRGAIQAANAHPGEDGIEFVLSTSDPNYNGTFWTIQLTGALPDITDSVSLFGPGADKLTVRRNTVGQFRIFNVTTTGAVVFSALTISNGHDPNTGSGGGIAKTNTGTLNITNATLSGNTTGAVLNGNATLTITNCTLSGNSSVSSGGCIVNLSGGTVNIINSTLSGNMGSFGGGAIFNTINAANLSVTNSTLAGNSGGFGGAVYNEGTMIVTNCTITGNTATASNGAGGGIHGTGGTVNVKSSIIALNMAGNSRADVSGPFTSHGFNLIGKNDGADTIFPAGNPNANNDIVGTSASSVDPKLELDGLGKPLLKNNGGLTQTVALLFGSPAIDKGTSNGATGPLSTDQRGSGFARTFDDPAILDAAGGDGTDAGAFEVQTAAPPSPTPTPTPTATPTATPPSSLGNISTRLRVLNGDNALFGGMIAIGTGGKKVIIRALGPTLTDFNLPGALQDPTLELFQGNVLIGSNDDWRISVQQAEIANSGFAPNKDAESAIIVTLTPNQNYSAIVRGKNGETGIGVVEAFDLEPGGASKLGNISTRGFVDVDDNVMIAGLIVTPSNGASVNVLVRALGPTLGDFGVQGFLADPTLDLVNANGTVLRSNDSWQSDQGPQIQATNLAPNYDQEAALIETLAPGQYTTIVRGSGRTTGVGLVEVYNIP